MEIEALYKSMVAEFEHLLRALDQRLAARPAGGEAVPEDASGSPYNPIGQKNS